ncbi:hypothetical protein BDB00DRAFT_821161 [Zychaea mexicana]|uniref:uncharacterized protein n=1 Tax=Zychaea mexicana TaxID=64656 RepID=UPI0022FE71B0|nr:uncharacterized protein BDB00DRAFT_821161 [Zychaea mexicana]KAI9493894.1 hypothetical protein BDB00DRAFT_821161 [Zychaea mexicana]
MFSGRHALEPEHDGSYFIDRDPLRFRLVLNYLRDLRIPAAVSQDKSMYVHPPHVCLFLSTRFDPVITKNTYLTLFFLTRNQPCTTYSRHELLQEAKYYRIDGLVKLLQ